jgi:DNA-directed RNA polymerase specialized sigma24 family protein
MIARTKDIETSEFERILSLVMSDLRYRYKSLHEHEDCESLLREKLSAILSSRGFEHSENPRAYLRRCLRNWGNRFFKSRIKQTEHVKTNLDLEVISNTDCVHRNRNSESFSGWLLRTEVRDTLASLPETGRMICDSIMQEDTCEDLAKKLGVKKQRAHQVKSKFLETAKQRYFKDYSDECN